MPNDDSLLLSDFYRCPKCRFIDYTIMESLVQGGRCPSCRNRNTRWQRLEVIEVLTTLRNKEVGKGIILTPPLVPPVV